MFLVGLTGGIACGKSTVADMLERLACLVVDADKLARQVVEPGTPGLKDIIKHFGESVLNQNGTLNREALGQIVFSDESKRRLLNSITHPRIYRAMVKAVLWHLVTGHQFVVLDLPLLFETKKMLPYMSYILVVKCDEETQLSRLMERNSLSKEDAQLRINAQMPLAEKCKLATHVIDNSGSIKDTEKQVQTLYSELRSSKKHWLGRVVLIALFAGAVKLSHWIYHSYISL